MKVHGTPLSKALKTPSPGTSSYSFFQGLLLDYLLFDKFAALVVRTPGGLELKRLPAKRVRMETNLLGDVIAIYFATEKDEQLLPLQDVIYAHGYEPGGGAGYSPVKTLGGVLLEAEEQVLYRRQLIRNGGPHGRVD